MFALGGACWNILPIRRSLHCICSVHPHHHGIQTMGKAISATMKQDRHVRRDGRSIHWFGEPEMCQIDWHRLL
jgi:hypothetical protein